MKLRISQLDLAQACLMSQVYDHVQVVNEATSAGNVVHSYLRDVNQLGREAALERIEDDADRAMCAAIDLSSLPAIRPDQYGAEIGVAYDPKTDTARILKEGEVALEHELPGHLDIGGVGEDSVTVVDYKSRWRPRRARDSWQISGYGVALARATGKSKATVAFIDRLIPDGDPRWDTAELDVCDLDARAYAIQELIERIAKATEDLAAGRQTPAPVQGPHCIHCPAFEHCPAKTGLMRAVVEATTSPEKEADLVLPLTPETAPDILVKLEAADKLLKRAWTIVDEYAQKSPVKLADGSVYGPALKYTEKLDATQAGPVLTEQFGADIAEAAIRREPSMTKASLKDALKVWVAKTPGAKITHVEKTALELLRSRGAVRVTASTSIGRHHPKPAALPAPAAK